VSLPAVSAIIPTCGRGALLLETVDALLALRHPPQEVLVVDQTPDPEPGVAARLARLDAAGTVRWTRRRRRSIPAAMNHGARLARGPLLLFLDDDVRIDCELVREHARAHGDGEGPDIVAGQVIQPWQRPLPPGETGASPGAAGDPDAFRFHASEPGPARRFMAGNVSMSRRTLVRLGGFDENFVGAAYRVEADLAERAAAAGCRMRFEPRASVHHLKAPAGGTRSFGHPLRTAAPWHSAGRYYYLLLHPHTPGIVRLTVVEALHVVLAREHLRAPWWIPISVCAEAGGLAIAALARLRGPRHTLAAGSGP